MVISFYCENSFKKIYFTVYTLACVLNTLKSDVTQMFSAFSWIEANMYSVLNSTIKLYFKHSSFSHFRNLVHSTIFKRMVQVVVNFFCEMLKIKPSAFTFFA